MKHIIVGTNRPGSKSFEIAQAVHQIYKDLDEPCEMIDLKELPYEQLTGAQYQSEKPAKVVEAVAKIEQSEGLIFVIPEYNGSYPGALKYFVDHWSFPDAFEFRASCFIGLGWQWGGLRPVEHFQQVMAYRNAYLFPKRVFIQNIGKQFDENGELNQDMKDRLKAQAELFCQFAAALKAQKIDANSFLAAQNAK